MSENFEQRLASLVTQYQTKLGRVIIDTLGEPKANEIHQLFIESDPEGKFVVRSQVSALESEYPERMIVHLFRAASRVFLRAREES